MQPPLGHRDHKPNLQGNQHQGRKPCQYPQVLAMPQRGSLLRLGILPWLPALHLREQPLVHVLQQTMPWPAHYVTAGWPMYAHHRRRQPPSGWLQSAGGCLQGVQLSASRPCPASWVRVPPSLLAVHGGSGFQSVCRAGHAVCLSLLLFLFLF